MQYCERRLAYFRISRFAGVRSSSKNSHPVGLRLCDLHGEFMVYGLGVPEPCTTLWPTDIMDCPLGITRFLYPPFPSRAPHCLPVCHYLLAVCDLVCISSCLTFIHLTRPACCICGLVDEQSASKRTLANAITANRSACFSSLIPLM